MIMTGQIKSRVFCHVSLKHDDAFEKQLQASGYVCVMN